MVDFLLNLRRGLILKAERSLTRRFGARALDVPLSMLVGVLAALVAASLHTLVSLLEKVSSWMRTSASPWLFILFMLMPFIGVTLSCLFQRFCGGPRYAKSLSPLILALHRGQTRIPFSEVFTHVISSAISVGCGGSTGLEAPSVLTGAAVGSNTASFLGIDRRRRLLFTGCGGAAAIAAIFQSPVGGILFAVEVLLPEFSVAALVPLLISSAVAMVVSRSLFPHEQVLYVVNPPWRTDAIPFYFLCGIICALVGVFIIRSVYKLTAVMKKYLHTRWQKLFIGGAVLTVILALFPVLRGQGYSFITQLYSGNVSIIGDSSPALAILPWTVRLVIIIAIAILLKAMTAVLTVDSGGDGGIFAPTMFVGAFVGFAFARLVNLSGMAELQEMNFVIVGICGVFSAVLRAPLTGIFLIADVTGSYILLVPLMIVSSVAWFIARLFEPHSIYNKALAESKLLLPDRDHTMLQRFSVRLCLDREFVALNPDQPLKNMSDVIGFGSSQEIFPVLDEKKQLVGIVSLEKLLPVMLDNELSKNLLIFDLMESPRAEVFIDSDLADAMKYLERFKLKHLPVKGKNNEFIGFVGRNAIFRLYRSMNKEQY
ncbi:MAG: chloride channel protein [Lentisphaeria bacterium]|nr:chloride channel protein [Lentisphaeria bacterium]